MSDETPSLPSGSTDPETTWIGPGPPSGKESTEEQSVGDLSTEPLAKRRSRRILAIVAVSVVLVLAAALGAIVLTGGSTASSNRERPTAGSPTPVANAPGTPKGFTTFRSTTAHFRIAIPNSWKAVVLTGPGAQAAINQVEQSNPNLKSSFAKGAQELAAQHMALLAINPASELNGTSPSVNVVAAPDATYSVDELSRIAATIPANYAKLGGKVKEVSFVTWDGHQALRASNTLPITTALGTRVSVAETQYFDGANGFLYVLTLTGSDPDLAAIESSFSSS